AHAANAGRRAGHREDLRLGQHRGAICRSAFGSVGRAENRAKAGSPTVLNAASDVLTQWEISVQQTEIGLLGWAGKTRPAQTIVKWTRSAPLFERLGVLAMVAVVLMLAAVTWLR